MLTPVEIKEKISIINSLNSVKLLDTVEEEINLSFSDLLEYALRVEEQDNEIKDLKEFIRGVNAFLINEEFHLGKIKEIIEETHNKKYDINIQPPYKPIINNRKINNMGKEIKILQDKATTERQKGVRADWNIIKQCKLDIMKLERKLENKQEE